MEFTKFQQLRGDIDEHGEVATLWGKIGAMKSGGISLFSNLYAVAQLVLVIPHSNAGEERVFSQVQKNLTEQRSSLSLETALNSMMLLKNTPGCEPCDKLKTSQALLKMAKSAIKKYNDLHGQ